jgi:hypothetical protein
MTMEEILELPVNRLSATKAHLYLWIPNALVAEGLEVMKRWGFTYKTNLVWYKIWKDGGPDGRGVGFYFRNVTELVLFGVRGNMRTLGAEGVRQTSLVPENRSIRESLMSFTASLKLVHPVPTSNFFQGTHVRAGFSGAMKKSKICLNIPSSTVRLPSKWPCSRRPENAMGNDPIELSRSTS